MTLNVMFARTRIHIRIVKLFAAIIAMWQFTNHAMDEKSFIKYLKVNGFAKDANFCKSKI
jgi:hypothetical protein